MAGRTALEIGRSPRGFTYSQAWTVVPEVVVSAPISEAVILSHSPLDSSPYIDPSVLLGTDGPWPNL